MTISNNPPSQIEFTAETASDLNAWMTDHPVIEIVEDAYEGKLLIDRATACLGDLEAERDSKVRPLNEQVKAINGSYKNVKERMDIILAALRLRLNTFLQQEETKRAEEARKAQKAAEEAEWRAVEAQLAEQAARSDASAGVVVDLGSLTDQANRAFKESQKAEREAARAEKETNVKIGGGFRRSLALRNKETLMVSNAQMAVDKLGWTEDIISAIIKAARAYRQFHGELPPGVTSIKERSL